MKKEIKNSYTPQRVILTSFFVDVIDIVINIIVVIATGSVVMLAELFQGIFDLIASGLLLVGLKRPKKEIFFWTGSSALVMLLIASTLAFYFGLMRFLKPETIDNIFLAFLVLVINAITNGYAFYVSIKRVSKSKHIADIFKDFNNSKKLMTKNTFVLDLMGMSAALIGLLALIIYQFTGDIRYDGLGAMGIGVVLALLSINLILDIKAMKEKGVKVEQ